MNINAHSLRTTSDQLNFDTEPLDIVSSNLLSRQGAKNASVYPALLVIDADEERSQHLARLLTLANYRPMVAATPVYAFKRSCEEPLAIQAILLGKISSQHRFFLSRLLQQLTYKQGSAIPIITLPTQLPARVGLYAQTSLPAFDAISPAYTQILEAVWHLLPPIQSHLKRAEQSLILSVLPTYGLPPRVSQKLRSRNSYFCQVLKAAYDLMGTEQWGKLMGDVGLAQYSRMDGWPSYNEDYEVPAEYFSCLNQAVAFSYPEDPIGQLRRWSDNATLASLEEKAPSMLMQRVFKFASQHQVMNAVLKSFTREMNEIRGEMLHEWIPLNDGNYWLVHYSNLYAYGRAALPRPQPMCHVWIALLEATLRLVRLERAWEVVEVECSCQTQTGHCLFGLRQRRTERL